jgi:hypothetical protein
LVLKSLDSLSKEKWNLKSLNQCMYISYTISYRGLILSHKVLISKIAVDKENKPLGKIIRIDDLLGKTIKKYKPYVMILVKIRFRKKAVVPIDIEKVIKVGGQNAQFDISKEDFDEEVKTAKLVKAVRETYSGNIGVYKTGVSGTMVFDPGNLKHKQKERKR